MATGTKLSQLTNVASLQSTDLLELSRNNAGSWASNSITITDLKASLCGADNSVVYVDKGGNDSTADGSGSLPFLTVKAALASITDNDTDHRYLISVSNGVFEEANPLVMKPFVTLEGISRFAQITALNNSLDLFVMSDFCEIKGLALYGPTTSGACVKANVAGGHVLTNIVMIDCNYGVQVANAAAETRIDNLIGYSGGFPIDTLIKVDSGSVVSHNIEVASGTDMTTIIHISGITSSVDGSLLTALAGDFVNGVVMEDHARFNYDVIKFGDAPSVTSVMENGISINNSTANITSFKVAFVEKALHLNNSAALTLLSPSIYQANVAIDVGPDGATTLDLIGGSIELSETYDIYVDSPDAYVQGMGFLVDEAKVYIDPNAQVYSVVLDDTPGDEGVNIRGELHVGFPEFPTESVFGEGDSYTRGMVVLTWDQGTTTYTDVSAEAASVSGSTFGFTGVDTNDAIYVSSSRSNATDYLTHYGIKASIDTKAVANVSSDIVAEYWNGAWTEVKTMSTESSGSYYPHADQLFTRVGSEQIRYDVTLASDSWAKTTVNGLNRYWVRFRIADGSPTGVTTAPIFQQFKLHTNRFEVNADGFNEYFGSSRPYGELPWNVKLLSDIGVKMPDEDVWMSNNLGLSLIDNVFDDDLDYTGFISAIPVELDTSSPIKFSWATLPTANGTITWTVRWGYTKPGDPIATSNPVGTPLPTQTFSNAFSTTSVGGVQNWYEVPMQISGSTARRENGYADTLWVTIERTTSTTNHALLVVDGEYVRWCNGGHI